MATVFKRGSTWVVEWKDSSGRRRCERTSCATKAQARQYADQLEHRASLQRKGLAPADDAPLLTFSELLTWYRSTHAPRLRSTTLLESVDRHLVPSFGHLPLAEVTPARLQSLLSDKARARPDEGRKPLSPKTLNHLRGFVRTLFNLATRANLWNGPNPALNVEPFRVPRRPPRYLRAEEVRLVIPQVAPQWRALFATAVYTGMRRG